MIELAAVLAVMVLVLASLIVIAYLLNGGAWLLPVGRQRTSEALFEGPQAGHEALVGHIGVVRCVEPDSTEVFVDDSLWHAVPGSRNGGSDLHTGDRVVVESTDGFTLVVHRPSKWEIHD